MSKSKGSGLKGTSGKPQTTPQFPAAGRRPAAPMVPKTMQRKASGRGR